MALEDLRKGMAGIAATIFSLRRQYKRLQDEGTDVDMTHLKEFQSELNQTVQEMETQHDKIIREHSDEVNVDTESKQFDDIVKDFTKLQQDTRKLINDLEFMLVSQDIDESLTVLEEALVIDDKATFHEDVQAIAEKMENLYIFRVSDTTKKDNSKRFRSRLMKIKGQIEARSDKKARSLSSISIATTSHHSSESRHSSGLRPSGSHRPSGLHHPSGSHHSSGSHHPSGSPSGSHHPSGTHHSSTSHHKVTGSTKKSIHNIKLPKLELPMFDGNSLHWPVFWERFSTAIDRNPDLSDEEKLAYLRGAMKDELASQIVSPATGSVHTYSTILALLKEEYENSREIHRKHIKALLEAKNYGYTYEDFAHLKALWEKHLTGLKATGQYDADHVFTSVAILNMPPKVYAEWAKYTGSYEKVPSVDIFQKFLKEHARTLRRDAEESVTRKSVLPTTHSQPQHKKTSKAYIHMATETSAAKCAVCDDEPHPLYFCHRFRQAPDDRKFNLARKAGVCTNCLTYSHKHKDCVSTKRCKHCQGKRHTMLHREGKQNRPESNSSSTPTTQQRAPVESVQSSFVNNSTGLNSAILMTAQVIIKEEQGRTLKIRALLDTESSASLLMNRVAQQLKLKKKRHNTRIMGIQGDMAKPSNYMTTFSLETSNPESPVTVTAALVDFITQDLPVRTIAETNSWEVTKGLQLADPTFYQSSRIDALIGMDVLPDVLLNGVYTGKKTEPSAFHTVFGWVIAGRYNDTSNQQATSLHISSEPCEDLNIVLQKFWQTEEVPEISNSTLTSEEQTAVDLFTHTTKRTPEGRYQVTLPRKEPFTLESSREQAAKRFFLTESRLRENGNWLTFKDSVMDYVQQYHAEVVPTEEIDSKPHYYLPMHVVIKPSSTTTKTRIVFDGSARSSNGKSLNSVLLPSPNVYPELFEQLVKFRSYPIAMTADVSKMFRQILLAEQDKDLHRFVFRQLPGEPLQDYRMKRLTFGITSSPYLATETLRQIAKDFADEYQQASSVVLNDFYVDDLLTGCHSVEEAITIRADINSLLDKGGFELRKWRSNSTELLETIPDHLREKETVSELKLPREHLKTLGIHWDTADDVLHISTPKLQLSSNYTKRELMSGIAQVYDVLGWFTPTILYVKCLIQKTWICKIDWDEDLPTDIQNDWRRWISELSLLSELPLPRCYLTTHKAIVSTQLHGFSDASEKGMAAVVYMRTLHTDLTTTISIIAAKSKVAPIKPEVIHRLELTGALILAKLMDRVHTILCIPLSQVYTWCDSTTVLSWLDGKPRKLERYVANRVKKITDLLPFSTWKYVPTGDNPADCASRGVLPKDLVHHSLWWHGPTWLVQEPSSWPLLPKATKPEQQVILCMPLMAYSDLLERYSTLQRTERVLAWVLRFYRNVKKLNIPKILTPLQLDEVKQAHKSIVKFSQQQHFHEELSNLQSGNSVSTHSSLIMLNPIIDAEGILRVGGRLQKSHLKSSQKHPIILHWNSRLSRLILKDIHQRLLHAGPQQMTADASQQYHILSCRKLARSIYRSCVPCRKKQARTVNQLMGQLPTCRFVTGHPFLHTGIDYAGPITIKMGRVRKPVLIKAYICVFISLSVKAVHLELVSDQTSEAFIAALRRFVARCGKPVRLHSDHGSNFIGANRELKEVTSHLLREASANKISDFCVTQGIEWSFIPERAPNFGGLWEATVKSVKRHLYICMKYSSFTFEELATLLAQIEAVLNSRPLVPFSSDDSDVMALTPGHFLIGQPLTAVPDTDYSNLKLLKRWNLVQKTTHDFWQRWSKEYIFTLNKFNKWRKPIRNLSEGDVVLVKGESTFCGKWPMGRIVQVYPGDDGKVRVADVRVGKSTYRRPASKLVILLPESTEASSKDAASGGVWTRLPRIRDSRCL